HAQYPGLDVGDPIVEVEHLFGRRIVVERVGGEVAPRRVLFLGAEDVVAQDAAVFGDAGQRLVAVVEMAAAKGRDLHGFAAEHHVHESEAAADDTRTAEDAVDLLGRGVGGNVEILGTFLEQQV